MQGEASSLYFETGALRRDVVFRGALVPFHSLKAARNDVNKATAVSKANERIDVRQLLRGEGPFGANEAELLLRALSGPQLSDARQEIQALLVEIASASRPSGASLLRAGISAYLLGQHAQAAEFFSRTSQDAVADYFHALTLSAMERHAEAEKKFAEAGKHGYDAVECTLRRAGEIRAQGRLDDAEATLRSVVT